MPPFSPHGWSKKVANAMARQQRSAMREQIRAERHRLMHEQSQVTDSPEAVVEEVPLKPVPEKMENGELRKALEVMGLDVPKTMARAKLIDLYKEHYA